MWKNGLLFLFFLWVLCLAMASTIMSGVIYSGDKTDYITGGDFSFNDNVSIIGNAFNIDDTVWEITASAGNLNTTIHEYSEERHNFTLQLTSSATVEFNITGFIASQGYVVRDGLTESRVTSDANGFISYTTVSISGERNYVISTRGCEAFLTDGSNCLASFWSNSTHANITLTSEGNCTIDCNLPELNASAKTQFDVCNWAIINGSLYNSSVHGCDIIFHLVERESGTCALNITAYNLNSSIGDCALHFAAGSGISGAQLGALSASITLTGLILYYNYTKEEE